MRVAVKALLEERSAAYETATLVVDVDVADVFEIAERVHSRLVENG